MKTKQMYSELGLLIITIIWGLGFPITKIAFSYGYDAYTIMLFRFLVASIVLTLVFIKKLKHIDHQLIKYGSITGVFLFLGFLFQTLGNDLTTSSNNGFITQLNIVFVPFLYFVFFKKKIDVYNVVSVLLAITGLYFLSFQFNVFRISHINAGDFLTFICAIMVAFNVVTGSYFQKKYDLDPALFVLINIYVATILSFVSTLIFTDNLPLAVSTIWPLIFMGILNTALGFLVQSYALKYSLPTRVSLIVTLEAVFAVIGGILIIGEELTVPLFIGGSMILIAVLNTELKPFQKK